MTAPKFIEEKAISLLEAKKAIEKIEKRDEELNYLSNKAKEYLSAFVKLSGTKREELHKKLTNLDLTRLKDEHIVKIIDFLPSNANDVKIVLQGYHMSLPKKDVDSIVGAVKDFV